MEIHNVLKNYDYEKLRRKQRLALAGAIGRLAGRAEMMAALDPGCIPDSVLAAIKDVDRIHMADWEQLENMDEDGN